MIKTLTINEIWIFYINIKDVYIVRGSSLCYDQNKTREILFALT